MESGEVIKFETLKSSEKRTIERQNQEVRKKNRKRITIIAAVITVLCLMVIYVFAATYFKTHFFFGTTVNGMDVSLKTITQTEDMILQELNNYSLRLNERDGNSEVIFGEDIGLTASIGSQLDVCMQEQNIFLWVSSLFKKTNVEFDTLLAYDQSKFDDIFNNLSCVSLPERCIAPVDAVISEYTDGEYTIIPEVLGSTVDQEVLKAVISDAMVSLTDEISLDEAGCYIQPRYTSESEEMKALCDTLNKYVSTKVTYTFDNSYETVDGDVINEWLSYDENLNAVIDETMLANYVQSLSSKYNTIFTNRNFATSYNKTVYVEGGDYGWWMDQITESAELKNHILNGETVTKEPAYKQKAASHGTPDYGNTYVEVNITAQHLFFYVDGKLVVESDFVSGTLSNGHGTPSGSYSITYTERDATLNGENYSTPVSYWMPFNGDIGLHDAGWRSKFGGFIYKNDGSHGCINLPVDVARQIFEQIHKGDPVIVYELPGTESPETLAEEAAKPVVKAIEKIGDVTLEKEAEIVAIRAQYEALSEMSKKYVLNLDVLTNAETALEALKAAPPQ